MFCVFEALPKPLSVLLSAKHPLREALRGAKRGAEPLLLLTQLSGYVFQRNLVRGSTVDA